MKVDTMTGTKLHSLIAIRHLTENTYVLRLDKQDITFKAGQHLGLGLPNLVDTREYSIYSGENEPYLEVIIKEVEEGFMSKKFKQLKPGDSLRVIPPVGYFGLKADEINAKKFVFIASGTGIAPFHSYVKSYPGLNYTILHGIRNKSEEYEAADYEKNRYISCTSRANDGQFAGRVTKYLQENPLDTNAKYYLCGNYEMIEDAYSILEKAGVPSENIKAEVYF